MGTNQCLVRMLSQGLSLLQTIRKPSDCVSVRNPLGVLAIQNSMEFIHNLDDTGNHTKQY